MLHKEVNGFITCLSRLISQFISIKVLLGYKYYSQEIFLFILFLLLAKVDHKRIGRKRNEYKIPTTQRHIKFTYIGLKPQISNCISYIIRYLKHAPMAFSIFISVFLFIFVGVGQGRFSEWCHKKQEPLRTSNLSVAY